MNLIPEAAEAIRRMRVCGEDLFMVAARLPLHQARPFSGSAATGSRRPLRLCWSKGHAAPGKRTSGKQQQPPRLADFAKDERRTAEALATLPLTVFLLDRPWNQGPALPGLTRVHDWAEVLSHLAPISGTVSI